ncbi:MAG: TolC family protein [Rhodospirillales bacterium]|jgi:adhesin transport system outer membrane protein|nr:TolC family protein [Rhodospirillales bacterium]MDP6773204.1 TolC family protein [Rhodospirillales bacterium]
MAAVVCAASPSFGRSLEKELAGLLLDHPQINASQKAVETSRAQIKQALAEFLPRVGMSSSIGPEITDGPSQRNRGLDRGAIAQTGISTSVTVTQGLFSGYSTASLVRTARLNKWLSLMTLDGTRQGVLLEGINSYINVLRQKRLIELARLNETNIQNQLNLEDERVQRGSGIAVDILQAKSRLQLAKERRINFEGGLKDAVSTYIQVFDHPPGLSEMLDPIPPVGILPTSVEEALETALKNNPALGSASATSEVARERRRSVMAQYFPTVDLVTTWTYEKNKAAVIGTSREYSMLLQVNWDLFTGLSTRETLAQVAFDYGASKDNHRFIARRVIEQTKLSWQGLLTVSNRLELLENAVNIAAAVFESRRKLREAGKETVINVLDAESEIFNAQTSYTSASYDRRLSVYQILLALGQLTTEHLKLNVE